MEGILDSIDVLDTRQFMLAVKKLADTLSYGMDRSPFLGSGIEFVQSRPYQWGDPIRSIDWRVTARTGRIYVKEYEAPKRMPCYLLIDTSASMTVSSVKKSKYAIGVYIAGGIALACLSRVSPVGIVGVGSRDLRFEPSLSPGQVTQWLYRLRRYRFDEPTNIGQKITQLAPQLTSRSLIIALTDLHDPQAAPAMKLLAQKHDCALIQFQDPAEAGIRGAGFLRASEAETGRLFITRGRRVGIDPTTTAQEMKRAGVDHLLVRTNEPFVSQLRHFFKGRNLLGRGTR